MRIFEIIRVALDSLLAHKTRAILTMLGIIIGVAAVVAMLSIGRGAQKAVEDQIASLGVNVLIIFPGATSHGGVSSGAGGATTLTMEDLIAIREQAPAVGLVSPSARTVRQVVAGNLNWSSTVQGCSPEFFTIRDWKVASGELFTEQDNRAGAKVCLVGKTVVDNLFPDQEPIGQTIRIQKIPFKIIGTLESKGQNSMGQDQDDIILAPFSTIQRKVMGIDFVGVILVSAIDKSRIADAQRQATEVLRQRHRLQDWEDNDFTIRSQTEIASAAGAATGVMTMLLGIIASISLLVGGIGIMNIMLVSVTERTREIGVRMSIGARRQDIMRQFLIEAIALSVAGGLLGIGLGAVASKTVSHYAGWPALLAPDIILMAFLFSAAVGVFFGYYPAQKASRLSPIEALRYE